MIAAHRCFSAPEPSLRLQVHARPFPLRSLTSVSSEELLQEGVEPRTRATQRSLTAQLPPPRAPGNVPARCPQAGLAGTPEPCPLARGFPTFSARRQRGIRHRHQPASAGTVAKTLGRRLPASDRPAHQGRPLCLHQPCFVRHCPKLGMKLPLVHVQLPCGSDRKNPPDDAGDAGAIPGSGRPPG